MIITSKDVTIADEVNDVIINLFFEKENWEGK